MTEAILREIKGELERIAQAGAAGPRFRGDGRKLRAQYLHSCCKEYGVSKGTIYRWLNREKRKKEHEIAPETKATVQRLFELQASLSDVEAGRRYPSGPLIRLAEEGGMIPEGGMTAQQFTRLVHQMGLGRPRGFVRFQAGHSNEMHQMDASGSEYLEVVEALGDDDWVLRSRMPNRRGKNRQAQPQRVWLAGLIDDFSGVGVWQYYVAPGESASWMRRFLLQVWEGIHPEIVLRGMPEKLYTDNGPFAKNETTIAFLSGRTGLGVEHLTSLPYNKRAHGKIERTWRTLWQTFELGFLGHRGEIRLSELNERFLLDFMLDYQSKKHRTGEGTRGEMYLSQLQGEVRLPAQNAQQSAFRVFDRRIDGNGLFQFAGKTYAVTKEARDAFREMRALVYQNAQNQICVENVLTGGIVKAEIWEGAQGIGDFESFPETATERAQKARDAGNLPEVKLYWGERTERAGVIEAPQGARVYADIRSPLTRGPLSEGQESETGPSRITLQVVGAQREENRSPMAAAERFASEIEARKFIAVRLGMGLLELRAEAPLLMGEIEQLVKETLEKERIAQWCGDIQGRLAKAIGGNS